MPDLLACSMATKHLRKIIMESSQLQYTIELGKYRMVSTLSPSVTPPFSTRLKLLRERERAWKYLDWKKKHTLRLPPTGSVYEFVGGLYGNGREDESRVTASISFLELPSTDDPGHELQMWTHSMKDIIIVDFTMDPSQDLLVLVALAPADSRYIYELHLRSIRTNQPHPKAPMSILSCLRKPVIHHQSSDIVAAVRVQVAGDLLALLIKEAVEGTTAHLEIWNWENSPQYSCAMGRADGIDDFTFLDSHSFLLVLPPGQFEVYTFSDLTKSSDIPVLRVCYAFPPLSDGYLYWYISMSSNPAPGYVPRSSANQGDVPGRSRQLYYPRPDERIHACCLYIYNPSNEENHHVHSFVFFLNLQSLLNPPSAWFESKSPRHKAIQRRPQASGAFSSSGGSPPPSAPFTAISTPPTETRPSVSRRSTSVPTYSSSNVSSSANGNSSNAGQHLPPYPPFPSFDSFASVVSGSNGQTSDGEVSSPNSKSRSRLNGSSNPPAQRSSGTRSLATLPEKVHTVPWDVWGPETTRWFEECLSTDWQHAVYGLRTVESLDPSEHVKSPSSIEESIDNPHFAQVEPESPHSRTYISVGIQTGNLSNQMTNLASLDTIDSGLQPVDGASSVASSSLSSDSHTLRPVNQSAADVGQDGSQGDVGVESNRSTRRFLRLRNFNPYSFDGAADPATAFTDGVNVKGKGKCKSATPSRWRLPRLVTEPSTTPVKGVFKKDIVSSLPYMEIISEEAFEVTDVMMDDCRLLLLKRGDSGKLKQVDVLMM